MSVEEFLELFTKELEVNSDLRHYYRLINNRERYLWRKAYFEQRLSYVAQKLNPSQKKVWDVGCGYATTSIFLTLNGFSVKSNTLEFYYDKIRNRLDYWSRFGNLDNLQVEYANLFDMPVQNHAFDAIIAQDTLHHLEPIEHALNIFSRSLKPAGRLIVTEENGQSLFIMMKNISKRGFNRISHYYDEKLQKTILFGNENARSLKTWRRLLTRQGFEVPEDNVEYVRLFPHFFYNENNYMKIPLKEEQAGKDFPLVRNFLFFGINFTAIQNKANMSSDNNNAVPVEVFAGQQWEAALVKSLLENAEIQAFMKDEIRGTTMPWQVTPGGVHSVKVVVSSDDLELARQVVQDFETNRNRNED